MLYNLYNINLPYQIGHRPKWANFLFFFVSLSDIFSIEKILEKKIYFSH